MRVKIMRYKWNRGKMQEKLANPGGITLPERWADEKGQRENKHAVPETWKEATKKYCVQVERMTEIAARWRGSLTDAS